MVLQRDTVDRCGCVMNSIYGIFNFNVALLNSIFLNHMNLSSTVVDRCGCVMNSRYNILNLNVVLIDSIILYHLNLFSNKVIFHVYDIFSSVYKNYPMCVTHLKITFTSA